MYSSNLFVSLLNVVFRCHRPVPLVTDTRNIIIITICSQPGTTTAQWAYTKCITIIFCYYDVMNNKLLCAKFNIVFWDGLLQCYIIFITRNGRLFLRATITIEMTKYVRHRIIIQPILYVTFVFHTVLATKMIP